jgi:hypothetical protein
MYIAPEDFRALFIAAGGREVALDDALALYDATAVGDESVHAFILRHKEDRAHWFTVATKAAPDAEELFSIDAQGRYAKEHGAAALGDFLKQHSMKPGQVKPRPKDQEPDATGENNPWSPKFKGSDAERATAQARIIKMGTKFAATMAASAGVTIGGVPLAKKK